MPLEASSTLEPITWHVSLVAIAMFALLMAFSSRYGFHRDELYFLDCARHLSPSYVDQPVLTPLVAWVSLHLFGVSVVGLRFWAALAGAASVVVGGLLAREYGGGAFAQLLGALGVATAPAYLGADHLLETTSFDLLLWPALGLVLVRLGRTANTRLLVTAGLILGVGLANKHSIGFFALAIVVGLVLARGSGLLFNRWGAIGLLVALALATPDLWWQATHGWPTIEMTRSLAQENGGFGNALSFLGSQLFMASPVLLPVWVLGLAGLGRSRVPMWRAFAWSYGLLVVFFAATSGAKPYYVAGLYPILIGAGAVVVEARWASATEANRFRRRFRWLYAGLGASVLLVLPATLPVLPASAAGAFSGINPVPAETVGWPQLVHTVAGVWNELAPQQRANAVIFTSNYGEAGAINELGRTQGLPDAVSGHNSEWFWGPGNPRAAVVVAVFRQESQKSAIARFTRHFSTCRVAATIRNAQGVKNQEEGGHVLVCHKPRPSWAALWPSLRHYD